MTDAAKSKDLVITYSVGSSATGQLADPLQAALEDGYRVVNILQTGIDDFVAVTVLLTLNNPKDDITNTSWKGEIQIHQGGVVLPTTISFEERDGDRIKGEIRWTSLGKSSALSFQGNIVDGSRVVWITDKKEGDVTYPGLYIGKIEGDSISGTWQVPSAGQYGRFQVKLTK
jgi:hypothetical protein